MDELPRGFVDRLVEILGSRQRLDELLSVQTQRSIRVNRLKATPETMRARFEALGFQLEPVPWCPTAFRVHETEDGVSLGNVYEHQAGHVFVQAPTSTLPVMALDPEPGDRVLDIAAAPGGKATHIAERLQGDGLVVANDLHPGRVNNMISNLDQAGVPNAIATQLDGCRLAWPVSFDKVLVDAPCSTLGSIHESWAPVKHFSGENVRQMAGTQRSLLKSAFHAVPEGGVIVYATCTIEPRENEAVASWFLEEFPVEIEPFDPGIGQEGRARVAGEAYHSGVEEACLVFADETGSESFFVARFRKLEEAPFPDGRDPQPRQANVAPGADETLEQVREAYGIEHPLLGAMRGFETSSRAYGYTGPSREEAMRLMPERAGLYVATPEPQGARLSFEAATLIGGQAEAVIELDAEQARAWLSGQSVELGMGHDVPERFAVVTCQGEPIGCARPFGTQLPCYVPKRNRVPLDEDAIGFLATG